MDKIFTNYTVENAKIQWRNFSGRAVGKRPAGKRTFELILPPDLAEDLIKEGGWTVKQFDSRDGEEPGDYHMTINIGYNPNAEQPKIFMVTNRRKTLLDEDTVGELDYAEIENIDLIFKPYNWEYAGSTGVSAYVKTMYVTIAEDAFSGKYDFDDDEAPFN